MIEKNKGYVLPQNNCTCGRWAWRLATPFEDANWQIGDVAECANCQRRVWLHFTGSGLTPLQAYQLGEGAECRMCGKEHPLNSQGRCSSCETIWNS